MSSPLPEPPTLAHHKLVLSLRKLRDHESGLFDLTEVAASRMVAAAERAAVALALTEAAKRERELRWLISELVANKALTADDAQQLVTALQ